MLSPRGHLAPRPKFYPRPCPCPRRFVIGLDMSLNFSFGPCEIVCNASIGNISEFTMVSYLCYLLTYVSGCCYETTIHIQDRLMVLFV